jgi:hypothetical protein
MMTFKQLAGKLNAGFITSSIDHRAASPAL